MVIVYSDAGGERAYVRDALNDSAIAWTEDASLAQEFADAGTASAFMSGKTSLPFSTITVTGLRDRGHKSHT